MTVFGNYDDLLPLLSEGIKTQVTREIFIHAVKTNKDSLGNYIKTLDTTENTMRGGKYYYVKNQHERGRSVVIVSFDDHEKIIALFYDKVPK
ncbi:MAG: hypothetical protein IPP30_07595 [Flavobacterium sp.]|nr:hypothetical protein [Flavobacterium sp.]